MQLVTQPIYSDPSYPCHDCVKSDSQAEVMHKYIDQTVHREYQLSNAIYFEIGMQRGIIAC